MNAYTISQTIGLVFKFLHLIVLPLLLPYMLLHILILASGKGTVRKDMLQLSKLLGILFFIGITVIGILRYLTDHSFGDIAEKFLPFSLLTLFCFLPALFFPAKASSGHRSLKKLYYLLPALCFAMLQLLSGNQYSGREYSAYRFLLLMPVFAALLLAAIWYLTKKNPVVGILLAAHTVLTFLFHPLFSLVVGYMMLDGILPAPLSFAPVAHVFEALFSGQFQHLCDCLLRAEFPLLAYGVLAQYAAMGIHSKRLPKESAAPQPPAEPICPRCKSKLNPNSKFCDQCGKRV